MKWMCVAQNSIHSTNLSPFLAHFSQKNECQAISQPIFNLLLFYFFLYYGGCCDNIICLQKNISYNFPKVIPTAQQSYHDNGGRRVFSSLEFFLCCANPVWSVSHPPGTSAIVTYFSRIKLSSLILQPSKLHKIFALTRLSCQKKNHSKRHTIHQKNKRLKGKRQPGYLALPSKTVIFPDSVINSDLYIPHSWSEYPNKTIFPNKIASSSLYPISKQKSINIITGWCCCCWLFRKSPTTTASSSSSTCIPSLFLLLQMYLFCRLLHKRSKWILSHFPFPNNNNNSSTFHSPVLFILPFHFHFPRFVSLRLLQLIYKLLYNSN